MLILSREAGQEILIDHVTTIRVLQIRGKKVED